MNKVRLTLVLTAGLVFQPAHAFFVMDEEHSPTVAPLSPSASPEQKAHFNADGRTILPSVVEQEWVTLDRKPLRYVKETGDGRAALVKGFGREQPLSEALKLIVPQGWKGYASKDVQAHTRKVSWRGGKPWTEVLESLGMEEGLAFDVDWTAQKVFVKNASRSLPSVASTSVRVSEGEASTETSSSVAIPRFSLREGEMLSQALERWGDVAGWRVLWGVDYDYRVEVDTDFGHDFEAAVEKVIQAYQARGGLYGVVAKVSKPNRVISIEKRS